MTCTHPIKMGTGMVVPCGKCMACRVKRTMEWSVRILDEASYYKTNTFLTLTYNDENLPKDGSLSKEEVQKYLKGYVKGWMVVRLSSTRPVNMEKKTEGRIII